VTTCPHWSHNRSLSAGIPNSAYNWQTLGNAISFISALIAALLYGNIGVKVIYATILRDLFHFPALDKKMGKIIWIAISTCPLYRHSST